MKTLVDFILKHTERGACRCGSCIDAPEHPEIHQPTGHTADLEFFKVTAKDNPDSEELRQLVQANQQGAFADVNLLDGQEHGYMEIGGWIGDQGLALMLMGLGSLLGLWKLLTPSSVLGDMVPAETKMRLAQNGMISIKA